MKKTIDPQDIVAIVDTREQNALNLAPLKTTRLSLPTGDYSVLGLTNEIAIERKSLDDLCMCVGRERDRFDRECKRLLGYPTRAIVVEATWLQIQGGGWRSRVTPEAVFGSLLGWIAQGVPVVMAGNHDQAGKFVSRMLFIAARRRWRELSTFFEARAR
jgi:DNA excision repair protein ERCC-4